MFITILCAHILVIAAQFSKVPRATPSQDRRPAPTVVHRQPRLSVPRVPSSRALHHDDSATTRQPASVRVDAHRYSPGSRENRARRDAMKDVILCSEQQESLDGIMLGDGHLELHGHEARLRIHHSGQQCDYVNKLYDIFSDYVLSPPACSEQHLGDKVFIACGFNTTTHPEFTRNWRAYYHATPETADSAKPTYVKRVPEDIDKRLTPKAFAHFISCDGSRLARSGIKLSTHSYSKSDNQRICDALATNFGINAVVRFESKKGGRAGSYSYIVIHRTYLEQVQKIVLPHLSPFFYYKVGLAPPR